MDLFKEGKQQQEIELGARGAGAKFATRHYAGD
jgi:hypothetical protein